MTDLLLLPTIVAAPASVKGPVAPSSAGAAADVDGQVKQLLAGQTGDGGPAELFASLLARIQGRMETANLSSTLDETKIAHVANSLSAAIDGQGQTLDDLVPEDVLALLKSKIPALVQAMPAIAIASENPKTPADTQQAPLLDAQAALDQLFVDQDDTGDEPAQPIIPAKLTVEPVDPQVIKAAPLIVEPSVEVPSAILEAAPLARPLTPEIAADTKAKDLPVETKPDVTVDEGPVSAPEVADPPLDIPAVDATPQPDLAADPEPEAAPAQPSSPFPIEPTGPQPRPQAASSQAPASPSGTIPTASADGAATPDVDPEALPPAANPAAADKTANGDQRPNAPQQTAEANAAAGHSASTNDGSSNGKGEDRGGQNSQTATNLADAMAATSQRGIERTDRPSFASALLNAGQTARLDSDIEELPARLRIAAANGVERLTVSLRPASLGAMEVQLETNEDGALRATFIVQ
ncbi:MAG: hypothetical protein AAGF58_09265, partial [Pseudomonadota bacterium]